MYAIFSVGKDMVGKADEILKDNIVSRQSIVIRDASALGIDSENRYILIEGNEDAIKRAEELFKDTGKLSEKEASNEELHKEAGKKVSEEDVSNEELSKEAEKKVSGEEAVAEEKIEGVLKKEVEEEPTEASEEKAEEVPKREIGKKLSEKEASEIYNKIKKEEENAAEGVGFIFGE